MHVVSFVSKNSEINSNPADISWISIPYNGRFPNVAVAPNKPRNAGNNPTKHPGQAPPSIPPNVPTSVSPLALLICFNSLIFITAKLIFAPTNKDTSNVNAMNGTMKYKLYDNTFSKEM